MRTCCGPFGSHFRVNERFVYAWNQTSHDIPDMSQDASGTALLTLLPLKAWMSPTIMISSAPSLLWTAAIVQRDCPKNVAPGPFSEQMKTDTLNLISWDCFSFFFFVTAFVHLVDFLFSPRMLCEHIWAVAHHHQHTHQLDLLLGRWGIILSPLLGIKGSLTLSGGHLGVWINYDCSLSPVCKSSYFGHSWRFIGRQIIEGITLFSFGIKVVPCASCWINSS